MLRKLLRWLYKDEFAIIKEQQAVIQELQRKVEEKPEPIVIQTPKTNEEKEAYALGVAQFASNKHIKYFMWCLERKIITEIKQPHDAELDQFFRGQLAMIEIVMAGIQEQKTLVDTLAFERSRKNEEI